MNTDDLGEQLAVELRAGGLSVEQQKGMAVRYREEIVGEYLADLVVNDRLIVELKVARTLEGVHDAQCLNYLRASGHRLCLLMNFSRPRLFVRRIING